MDLVFHLAENPGAKPFAFLCSENGQKPISKVLTPENMPAVIEKLAPVIQESRFAAKYSNNNRLFHAIGLEANDALLFLEDVEVFQRHGIGVRLPDLWAKKPPPKARIQIDLGQEQSTLRFYIAGDEKPLTSEEVERILAAKDQLLLLRGQWVEVNAAQLLDLQNKWHHVVQMMNQKSMSFMTAFRLASGRYNHEIQVQASAELKRKWKELTLEAELPKDYWENLPGVQLRDYQKQGVAWLYKRYTMGVGSCLADDMGLGKTLQILTLIRILQGVDPRFDQALIVAPSSLLENWQEEAHRFYPDMDIRIHHTRYGFKKAKVTITSYSMILKQYSRFHDQFYSLIVLDEAQAIKNPLSQISQHMKGLNAEVKIALTGTPIENSKVDLWSIFEFIDPEIFGDLETFSKSPKEYLKSYLKHFILRRMKTDPWIVPDLPAKSAKTLYVELETEQRLLYKTELDAFQASTISNPKVDQNLNSEATEASRGGRISVLSTINKLKQICNHPNLYQKLPVIEYDESTSSKFRLLLELVQKIARSEEKFIVFSHYRDMLHAICEKIKARFTIDGRVLTGNTPLNQRQEMVHAFQSDPAQRFLCLSLKAAGVGLNLTAANHVIHYDRWWNPAVEDQASDRSYRIGQRKNVQVYYLVNRGTLESGIAELLSKKRQISDGLLDSQGLSALSLSELTEAMKLYAQSTL